MRRSAFRRLNLPGEYRLQEQHATFNTKQCKSATQKDNWQNKNSQQKRQENKLVFREENPTEMYGQNRTNILKDVFKPNASSNSISDV